MIRTVDVRPLSVRTPLEGWTISVAMLASRAGCGTHPPQMAPLLLRHYASAAARFAERSGGQTPERGKYGGYTRDTLAAHFLVPPSRPRLER
jgi:hypothetical protein